MEIHVLIGLKSRFGLNSYLLFGYYEFDVEGWVIIFGGNGSCFAALIFVYLSVYFES